MKDRLEEPNVSKLWGLMENIKSLMPEKQIELSKRTDNLMTTSMSMMVLSVVFLLAGSLHLSE